jgi:hypothetical protein
MVSQLHYFGLKLRQKNMVAGARRRGGCSPRHSQKAERERERERGREGEREGGRERERERKGLGTRHHSKMCLQYPTSSNEAYLQKISQLPKIVPPAGDQAFNT